jgi:peptidoglycan/xylan/chitin deacetylase (PgdA/CDA1 family)
MEGLRGRIAPGPTILVYHCVHDVPTDPQMLSVTPAHFEEHLAVLQQHYRVLPLNDLITALLNGTMPARAVAITFDDGYANNYEYAWPLLKKYSMPATIFVSTSYVSSNREFLCDELERILLRTVAVPEVLLVTIENEQYEWRLLSDHTDRADIHNDSWSVQDAGHPSPAHQAYRELNTLLRYRSFEIQERVMNDIRIAVGDNGVARQTHRALSREQIRVMSDDGLVDIGAHTVNHAFLSSLAEDKQQSEIADSIRTIESWTEKKVTSFAYPYGTRDSYNERTRAIVQESGCRTASSNFRGRIYAHTDPFQLPRLVVRDCTGDFFHQYVKRNAL